MASSDAKVRLDLNNPVFQDNLLTLQKSDCSPSRPIMTPPMTRSEQAAVLPSPTAPG